MSLRRTIGSTDALHIAIAAVLLALSPLAITRGGADFRLPAGYAGLAAAVILLARLHAAHPESRLARVLHTWYPLPAVVLVFWSLSYVIPAVNPGGMRDAALIEWDHRIFRTDLVELFRRLEHPLLTDALHILYVVYFVLPVLLVWPLLRRRGPLEETIFVLCLSFYLCYVGYGLVPAAGPRYAVYGHNGMAGLLLTQPIRDVIDALEPGKADVFPSAHAAVTLVVNWLALRHLPRLGRALVPVTAGILASLVYTRYHYGVDVLAGGLWAVVTVLGGTRIHAFFVRRRAAIRPAASS
ncbi:MAG: phosphatase PAP2 family protein [Planctomycetes bacterium]|jgi:membrane-associated phospholipid phosphatase|nr:phosphatase PAP2 family protein [Planctomycetota bacterium]